MVEPIELLYLGRLAVGGVGLSYAAYTDIKTRRVRNPLWWVMGAFAGVFWLTEMYLRERPWEYFALLGPLAVFFIYAYVDPSEWPWKAKRIGYHGLQAAAVAGLFYLAYLRLVPLGEADWDFAALMAVPLLMGLMVGAYNAGLMVGGADVKAVMVVALLAPTYPEFSFLPWELLTAKADFAMAMPFVVYANSLLIYLAIPVSFFFYNLARRHWGPPFVQMFFGHRLPIEKARQKHVWPMERVVTPKSSPAATDEQDINKEPSEKEGAKNEEEGENANDPAVEKTGKSTPPPQAELKQKPRIIFEFFPRNRHDTQQALDRLEAAGRSEVWVTPKTPYMVPLAVAWFVSYLVGDIFFRFLIIG